MCTTLPITQQSRRHLDSYQMSKSTSSETLNILQWNFYNMNDKTNFFSLIPCRWGRHDKFFSALSMTCLYISRSSAFFSHSPLSTTAFSMFIFTLSLHLAVGHLLFLYHLFSSLPILSLSISPLSLSVCAIRIIVCSWHLIINKQSLLDAQNKHICQ